MPKQGVSFNFQKGLDLKTDPWQVPFGSFESLENSIFQKGGLMQKRNGYGLVTPTTPDSSYLTTLNNNLVSIGQTVNAYSSSLGEWITQGVLEPCSLNVLPLLRNNLNQIQCDSVIAGGLVLTTYTQTTETLTSNVTNFLYVIADAVTGQNIVAPSSMPVLSGGVVTGSSRVFVISNYFVIVSPVMISSSTFLQYVTIPIANPSAVSIAQNVTSEVYVPISANPGWDGVVSGTNLVIAYNTTSGAQGVHVTVLTAQQLALAVPSTLIHAFAGSTFIAAILTIAVDQVSSPNIFYISFWNNSTLNGYTCAVYLGFGTITVQFTPQQIISSQVVLNLASAAPNNFVLVYYEVQAEYSYDSTIPTNFINAVPVASNGTVASAYTAIRSVGLASKAFTYNGTIYFLAAFQSPFQPSYFLINGSNTRSSSPKIVAKLAYENGAGYITRGLPSVTLNENVAQLSYLYKDDVEALSTQNNPQQLTTGGIYSQLGVNLISFTLGTVAIDSAEIAQNLHISGGYLSMYDGYLPVEHDFFVWPDSVEVTYTQTSTVTPTGTVTMGSSVVTSVSSVTGVSPGMTITGTGIPAGATVVFVNPTSITISVAAGSSHSSETLTIQGNLAAVPSGGIENGINYYYQVTYEWTDNQGLAYRSAPSIPVPVTTASTGAVGSVLINVPTLRLTAKVANPVKIVIYRWSEGTQVYNQVTSIIAPLLNDTTIDQVSFVDPYNDSSIVGNNLIYTTGGVVEDVNAPASDIMTLFDTRLWLVDAEDRNTLWVSKQVIEQTPVEMSDLFTIYVAPNIGTTASTGPITALAPMDDKLIIFKNNAIYYINGVGPNNLGTTAVGCSLGNYSQPTFITSVVGCTNQQSIVLTPNGLMFQSDKGIWQVARDLQVTYIGSPVEDFNSSVVNSAVVVPETNYVLFTLSTGEYLMYDYYYSQWGTFVGAPAVSSCIYNGLHTILTPQSEILQETPGLYLDNTRPVLMSFTTSWINLASLQGYERFYECYLLAKYLSPHKLQVQVGYDYNPSIVHQAVITPKLFSSSVPSPFGIPTPFGSRGNKEQERIHAKQQLCESFQLSVTEIFDSTMGAVAGAGFTMSGVACVVDIKKATRPIRGSNASGLS